MKKALSLFLALMLCVSLAVPALAADPSTVWDGNVEITQVIGTETKLYNGENVNVFVVTSSSTCIYHHPASGKITVISHILPEADGVLSPADPNWTSDYYGFGGTQFDNTDLGKYFLMSFDVPSVSSGNSGYKGDYFIHVVDPNTYKLGPVVVVSPQKVTLDGASVEPEHYNIDGENYFKLRDLAHLLNGTSAQFEVGYNDATKTISVTTGKAYTPNGDEMIVGADKSATCVVSAQTIEINGKTEALTAYNIGGNNFFRLRDLNELLGYGVDYDAATNTAVITTK